LPDTPLDFAKAIEGLSGLAMPEAPLGTRERRLHLSSDRFVEMREANEELAQSLEPHGQMKPVQQVLGARAEVPLE
jgi:hypothetical protein